MSDDVGIAGALSALSPHEIYSQVYSGPGPESLEFAQQLANTLALREDARARQLAELAEEIAADARGREDIGGAAPLAEAALDGAALLHELRARIGFQLEAFGRMVSELQPVTRYPPEPEFVRRRFPFESDTARETAAYQADAERNLLVFARYESAYRAEEPVARVRLVDPGGEVLLVEPDVSLHAASAPDAPHSRELPVMPEPIPQPPAGAPEPAEVAGQPASDELPVAAFSGVVGGARRRADLAEPPMAGVLVYDLELPTDDVLSAVPEPPIADPPVVPPPPAADPPTPAAAITAGTPSNGSRSAVVPRDPPVGEPTDARVPSDAALGSTGEVPEAPQPSGPPRPAPGPQAPAARIAPPQPVQPVRPRPITPAATTPRNVTSPTNGAGEFGPLAGFDPGTGFPAGTDFGPSAGYAGVGDGSSTGSGSAWSARSQFIALDTNGNGAEPGQPKRTATNGDTPNRNGPTPNGTEPKRATFLVEPDDEDIFASDQLTAPPVIGE